MNLLEFKVVQRDSEVSQNNDETFQNHPLHVVISWSTHRVLCNDKYVNESICALLTSHICINAKYVIVHSSKHHNHKDDCLYVTNVFLQHYGIHSGQKVFLKSVKIVSLDKVVFGVKSTEAFERISKLLNNKETLLDMYTNTLLCRQGDVCLFSNFKFSNALEIICLQTEPFLQGCISFKTSVVVKEIKVVNDEINADAITMFEHGTGDNFLSYWNIVNYAGRIVLPHSLINSPEKSLFDSKFNEFTTQYHELNRQLSIAHLSVNILPNCPFDNSEVFGVVDSLSVLFIHQDVLDQFNILDKSWVEIEIVQKKSNSSRKTSSYGFEVRKQSSASSDCISASAKLQKKPRTPSDGNKRPNRSRHSSGNEQSSQSGGLRSGNYNCGNGKRKSSVYKIQTSPSENNVESASFRQQTHDRNKKCTHHRNVSDISFPTFEELITNVLGQSYKHAQHSTSHHIRIAQVFALCSDNIKNVDCSLFECNGPSVAYISPLLWFNLNVQPSELIKPDTKIIIKNLDSKKNCDNNPIWPSYASEVQVTLIQSPDYSSNVPTDNLLHKYFATPRVVHKGDIFAVYSEEDSMFHHNNEDCYSTSSPLICFRISSVEGPPDCQHYLADSNHTSLYQVSVTQDYIPVVMKSYMSNIPVHPIWTSPLPFGLVNYVEQVKETIWPFMKDCKSKGQRMPTTVLITGPHGAGKTTVIRAVTRLFNLHIYEVNCYGLNGDSAGASEARIRNVLSKAEMYAPCIVILRHIEAIGKSKEELGYDLRVVNYFVETVNRISTTACNKFPVIIVATGSTLSSIHSDIRGLFIHQIDMKAPSENERLLMLQGLLSNFTIAADVSLLKVVQGMAGFSLGDLVSVSCKVRNCAYFRIKSSRIYRDTFFDDEENLCLSGIILVQDDFDKAVGKYLESQADSIGALKIPDVTWNDIGGLDDVKKEIIDTIQLPLKNPYLMKAGLHRSGVLLYGPPGTGKTLLAKAVSNECSLNFMSVKGPELINMYVGQSEENVRQVFRQARNASPCVIFFDELDSLAPNRGKSGDSGGVMDRVVSQLLAEMDGVNKSVNVFVMGATNRPDLLDPALLRPGRFDCLLYVGISKDKKEQLKILTALTRNFNLSSDVDLSDFIDKCSSNLTGADFYALCSDALLRAISRSIDSGKTELEDDEKLYVEMSDFESALRALTSSVSAEELDRYEKLHSSFTS